MRQGEAAPARQWLDIEIEHSGDDLRIQAQGSRDERPRPHGFAPAVTADALSQFARDLRDAASEANPLGARLEQAWSFHQALFQGELETVKERLREAAGGKPLLVRFLVHDGALQAFPWEALCKPQTKLGVDGHQEAQVPGHGSPGVA